MIIDMLTHIGVKKGEAYKVESLIELMDNANVDKAMICSQLETIDNDYIYESTIKYPDRTLGFAVINPWDIDGEEQLEKCFKEFNFYGLKLNAIRFGYSADRHSLLDPYFELCKKYSKIVVVHGMSDQFSLPEKWAEMAKKFPEVPIVLYHMGIPLAYDNAISLAKEIDNLYLSTCGSYVPVMKKAYETVGARKILFSSDAPFGDMEQELLKVRYITSNEDDLEMILSGNARRLMNI
ncbi:amidohydrolase family protein [Tepidimicrobium xylanilyticum]|uniref:amidohydrolase family protein n=1 Tax=Tepidimicrobium xylanilyticum TaxID=1123352 RepID=UPI002650E172|nr:amidohydrolase family protein [Tepidimicrobium xylanilyticum]GMG97775.1 metal-dependent hydrolase [Tepidimicrobium xylanilyticum]